MNAYFCTIIYCLLHLVLFAFYRLYCSKKNNATTLILVYFLLTSFFSILYFSASNGIYRDYSNITLLPYFYLILCFLITIYPIYNYDKSSPTLSLSFNENKIIYVVSIFIGICTLLPFLETLIQLPNALANSNQLNRIYEERLAGESNEYLSFFGRKFFYFIWLLNNLVPIFIFINLMLPSKNKKIILLLCLALITIWLHAMILGGRSKLVQNALYMVIVYFIFKRFLHHDIIVKVNKYGFLIFSVAILGVVAVTISRFNNMDSTNMNSIWEWIGLYAGEGSLNFNSSLWYVRDRSTEGYSTFPLLLSWISGKDFGVADSWALSAKLGISGNIFYTYVGSIFQDFNVYGTIIFILTFSFLVQKLTKCIRNVSLAQLIVLCLWAKILIIGPIFYTYGTVDDQKNLLFTILFSLYLHSCNKRVICFSLKTK